MKVKKKPIVINAKQATKNGRIKTLEGTMYYHKGDYILMRDSDALEEHLNFLYEQRCEDRLLNKLRISFGINNFRL